MRGREICYNIQEKSSIRWPYVNAICPAFCLTGGSFLARFLQASLFSLCLIVRFLKSLPFNGLQCSAKEFQSGTEVLPMTGFHEVPESDAGNKALRVRSHWKWVRLSSEERTATRSFQHPHYYIFYAIWFNLANIFGVSTGPVLSAGQTGSSRMGMALGSLWGWNVSLIWQNAEIFLFCLLFF